MFTLLNVSLTSMLTSSRFIRRQRNLVQLRSSTFVPQRDDGRVHQKVWYNINELQQEGNSVLHSIKQIVASVK